MQQPPFAPPASANAPRSFKAFRRFNDPALMGLTGRRERLEPSMMTHFPGDSLPDRIARELATQRVLPIKELFESFEFFERTRRRLRAPHVADVCCGHGLTGVLFAVFEPSVEQVTLVDRVKPPSFDRLITAIAAVAPWVTAKVRYDARRVQVASRDFPARTSVVAVHACGARTDRALEAAIEVGGHVAVMPCCYFKTASRAPRALHKALSADMATDIDRTYRLEAAGYEVEWSAVPPAITACHRIVVGRRAAE